MATGTVGNSARENATQQINYIRSNFIFSQNGTTLTVGTIPAHAAIVDVNVAVRQAFDDSGTNTVNIGSSLGTATTFMNGGSVAAIGVKTSGLYLTATASYVSSAQAITMKYAGQNSDMTGGAGTVVISFIPNNDRGQS